MSWEKWVLIGLFAFGALYTIGSIGKQRKPIDPSLAVWNVLLSAAYVALVVFA